MKRICRGRGCTAQYPESNRWYGGAGLYRECALEVYPENHIVPDSVFITTSEVTKERALVRVTYEMSGEGKKEKAFEVRNPHLWDVDDPYLYTLEIEGAKFRYGIRFIDFFADERGFQLNGRRVQLRGMCLHQDLGALGSAWNRAAWARRLGQLKVAGVGSFHAADNGDGADMTAYRWPERDVFNGYLSVIVAPKRGESGAIRVKVSAAGLAAGEVEIEVERQKKGYD